MSKIAKYSAAILLVLLTIMALTTVLTAFAQDQIQPPPEDQTIPPIDQFPPSLPLPAVGAQEAFVTVKAAVGGTTSPAPGAYRYPTGQWFNLTAVPYKGFKFLYWTISGALLPQLKNLPPINFPDPIPENYVPQLPDPAAYVWENYVTSQNPLNVICGYGYNYQYQPVFTSTSAPSPGNNTIVTLLEALGGTSSVKAGGVAKAAPGTYTYAGGQGLTLEATAADGYAFSYWIATGAGNSPDTVIVNNPADISCQEGTAYTYQPVFVPHNAPATETGIPVMYFYAAIVVLAIIAVIGLGVALMYRSRGKK